MRTSSSPEPKDCDHQSTLHKFFTRHTTPPQSLRASISPPPSRARKTIIHSTSYSARQNSSSAHRSEGTKPSLAAVEAEEAQIRNHLEYSSSLISSSAKLSAPLSIRAFEELYKRNQHEHGRHWVIHQHDHPVAGVHYDLRLQISETSSISWAIMYGLPGNVNSRRLNRNATETRVHNVWNHLIESASASTGSLLIWDTGEYEMLPCRENIEQVTDDELSDYSDGDNRPSSNLSDSEKLHAAFRTRKIRIRLHGTRLPSGYTMSIRLLPLENRHEQPAKSSRKRRRKAFAHRSLTQETPATSDPDDDKEMADADPNSLEVFVSTFEREIAEQEDEKVRLTNAYPGATNSIGSIHQRRWYLSMDRYASGFCPIPIENRSEGGRKVWARRREGERLLGFEPFFVLGRELERSVVTGRTADEVMADDGVQGFVGRKGWRPVTE
ncbi:MAG: hypothetical protein ALECFALPRED_007895 [Alectoria fallacina]|uniref:DNA ligase D 3'-phosphoesterase domain-containing protein n=1 Tax=Alectoria fallacina TaxID=1903189 RepID=A0A8H3IFW8_9LECA|nr:MAG: hypothetical protein ALECFALPRED_007895 [Alectoria fallacina]